MDQRNTILTGVLLMGLGVIIGAFGAHALSAVLTENGRLDTYETAVRYQFYHALGLLVIGLLMDKFPARLLRYAAICIFFGVLIFSGSLYILSITGITILGAVTPFGGALMIVGWVLVFTGVLKNKVTDS